MSLKEKAIPMVCQENNYWIKCSCGWQGYEWQMVKGYAPLPPDDVTPMLKCPHCGRQEDMCDWHEFPTCSCGRKLEYFSGLEQIPEYLYCPHCNNAAYDIGDCKLLFRLI